MGVIQNLMLLYAGAALLNLALAAVLWARQRSEHNRSLFLVWATTLGGVIAQGASARGSPLVVTLAYTTTFFVNLAVAEVLAKVARIVVRWPVYAAILALGILGSLVASGLSSTFWVISLPVSLAAALPLTHTTLRVLATRRRQLSTTGMALAVSCLLFCAHNIDFAFVRDRKQLEAVGITVALLIIIALSTTALGTVLEQVAAERAAAVELDQYRRRFFANITHELRTPLTMILAPLEALLEGDAGALTTQQRSYLWSTRQQALRLLRTINDLLDLARLEEGRLPLRIEAIDLAQLVRQIIEHTEPLAARKQIELGADLAPGACDAAVDGHQIERVFVNLLANALKFTEPGGRVVVAVAANEAFVHVSVSDTGCGIPEDKIAVIFERFTQADSSVTRRYGGTGIGLAFVREIVELHHGAIEVESRVGVGSTFTVRLPRRARPDAAGPGASASASANASARARTAASASAGASAGAGPSAGAAAAEEEPPDSGGHEPREWTQQQLARLEYRYLNIAQATERRRVKRGDERGKRTRILVVEDNVEVLSFVQLLLGDRHAVYVAENGEEGLRLATSKLPDLIVTDYMMPRMDGLSMIEALKHSEATAQIPVIMLTAHDSVGDRVAARQSGADIYLGKPFSPKELDACVARLLARRGQLVSTVADAQVRSLASISAGLAHEINNPLSYIRTALVVLQEKTGVLVQRCQAAGELGTDAAISEAQARIQRMADIAFRGVTRIEKVVSLLRGYAREGYPATLTAILFDDAVRQVLAVVASRKGAPIQVEARLTATDCTVHCVPQELHQAITNLVQNALDAAESQVRVESRQQNGEVVLEVTDDGPGIPPEVRGEVFVPFFSTKEPGQGMGLGLSIAREVVSRAGGSIDFCDAQPRGTTFSLRLPHRPEQPS